MSGEKRDNEIAYSYDQYIEPPKMQREELDNYEEFLIKKGEQKMKREIIKITNLTFGDLDKIKDYVWKGEYLIPAEMIEGK